MATLRGFTQTFAGGTSQVHTTPYPHEFGARAFDSSGSEYIYCQFESTVYGGLLGFISRDGTYTFQLYSTGNYGNVGVVIAPGTSDNAGWVQIGGYTAGYVQCVGGSSLATSSGRALKATSLSSPATGLLTVSTGTSLESDLIKGMWLTQLTSSGTTSATSATGLRTRVYMDHPYITQPDATS